jgi:hypothetical protein
VSIVKTFAATVTGVLLAASALIAPVAADAAPPSTSGSPMTPRLVSAVRRWLDSTMAACSTGRRSQNEPTVAVDPRIRPWL